MKALLRIIPGIGGEAAISAPDRVFDGVRADAGAARRNPTMGEVER